MPTALRLLTRRALATFAVGGLIAAGGVVLGPPAPASAATHAVSGSVFRDFNGNGVRDTGAALSGVASDEGIANLVVTATDASGASWTGLTAAVTGNYTISVVDPVSTKLRITFPTPSSYEPSGHGSANGTSVQFVDVGSGPATASYAVNVPEDYAQANPPIVTAIQYSGLRGSATLVNSPTLVAQPWSASYTLAAPTQEPNWNVVSFPGRTTLATVPQTGSIWGTAYDKASKSVFAAATYKRHSDLGPLGLGGIYRVSNALTAAGAINAGATTSSWLDVTAIGIVVGSAATNATRALGLPQDPSHDDDAFANAAKIGIGGITIDPATHILYLVNLNDQKVYSFDVDAIDAANDLDVVDTISPAVELAAVPVQSYDLGLTTGQRPWAIELHRGMLYVGYVDSGEANPGVAASSLNLPLGLQYHVKAASLGALGTWSVVLDGSLGYARGEVAPFSADPPQVLRWNSWVDAWSGGWGSVAPAGASWGALQLFPQAILTDLSFDTDGYLAVALSDRTASQAGNRNYGTGSDTALYQAVASGDLLIASPDGDGTFTPENNGAVGTRTSLTGGAGEGPGGKEFFNDRHKIGTGAYHFENSLGAAANQAGLDETVATVYDPLADVRVAGLNWFQSDGVVVRGYQHNRDSGDASDRSQLATGTFQKAGGLGDVDALALEAPLEIGNRVWFDGDQDGVQDADEPGVAGVTVELLQGATVISTVTTPASGEYYFSSASIPAFTPDGGAYTVQFTTPSSGSLYSSNPQFGSVGWSDVRFTTPNVGGDTLDSDAVVGIGIQHVGTIAYTAGSVGENDHSLDAGLAADAAFQVIKELDPAGGAAAPGATFDMAVQVHDFRGNAVSLAAADAAFSISVGGSGHTVTVPAGSTALVTETSTIGIYSSSVSPSGWFTVNGTTTTPHVVTVTNRLEAPDVDIEKGDGDAGVIDHDADTMPDGEHYEPGETRTIVFVVTNPGTEHLRDVELSDTTLSGAAITAITWTFPDSTTANASYDADTRIWSADWAATFGTGPSSWAPGDVITGEATLTIEVGEVSHVDRARVDAVGAISANAVFDEDDYNAFTGDIQIIKYDGRIPGPAVQSGGDWVIPAKPMANPFQDANDDAHAAQSTANVPVKVDWLVTNIGTTTLTDLMVTDTTLLGPAIEVWTCDLSDFGGPADYSFLDDGAWPGLLPPSASFFCTGSVTLQAGGKHTNVADVEAHVVVPEVDGNGVPTGNPLLIGQDDLPVLALDEFGEPVVVDDDDPFRDPAALPSLALTGVEPWMPWAAGIAVVSVLIGLFVVVLPRRRRSEARAR